MVERGAIRNVERYKQLIDFSGLIFERKITPTDIDLFLDFNGTEAILGEFKLQGKSLPYGQRRALNELLKDATNSGKHTLGFVAEHQTPPDQQINAATCLVVEYWSDKTPLWKPPKQPINVREMIDRWREWRINCPNS